MIIEKAIGLFIIGANDAVYPSQCHSWSTTGTERYEGEDPGSWPVNRQTHEID